ESAAAWRRVPADSTLGRRERARTEKSRPYRRTAWTPPAAAPRRRTSGGLRRGAAAPSSRPVGGRDRRYPTCISPESASDGPELHGEPWKFACDVHGHSARRLELAPQRIGLIELEIGESGVVGDLPRRDRNRVHRHTPQLQPHEVRDLLHWSDFELR